jgi:hypothetical protein
VGGGGWGWWGWGGVGRRCGRVRSAVAAAIAGSFASLRLLLDPR